MEAPAILPQALGAVEAVTQRAAALVRAADPTATPPNSRWPVRDVAAHLISGTALYTELAAGAASPLDAVTPEALRTFNAQRIADIADTDPDQLAKSITDTAGRFLDAAGACPPQSPVRWHAGIVLDSAQLACVLLGEYLLHGLDIATATGAPWPIDPAHAALVLYGYGPVYPACVDPTTSAGHSSTYQLDLGPAGRLTAQFTDGTLAIRPATDDEARDCTITAEPTTFLLVSAGRMPQSTAIALRLLDASGARPELGLTFARLFRYP